MPTDSTLRDLRAFIGQSPSDRRAEFLSAFDDLAATIAAQALLVRALSMRLRNIGIGASQLTDLLTPDTLAALSTTLGRPIDSGITLAQAERAAAALADSLNRPQSDPAAVLAAVVRIVAVFI